MLCCASFEEGRQGLKGEERVKDQGLLRAWSSEVVTCLF